MLILTNTIITMTVRTKRKNPHTDFLGSLWKCTSTQRYPAILLYLKGIQLSSRPMLIRI
nr:hypothetical protein [uncultured bacterium]